MRQVRATQGYNGDALQVSGCRSDGSSASLTENGTYLRQPPYDNIEGHEHFIKLEDGVRRHLFFKKIENAWQIAPICTDDEGAFALSETPNVTGAWRTIPPNILERSTKFKFLSDFGDECNTYEVEGAEEPEEEQNGVFSEETLLKWECRFVLKELALVHIYIHL